MAASSSKPSRVAYIFVRGCRLVDRDYFQPDIKKASHSDAGINFKNAVCEKHH